MATSTEQRYPTADSQTGTVSSTTITTLRSNIAAGNLVNASDVQSLINLYNTMIGHYHTYTDRYQIATFGNNGDRNTYDESKSTSPPSSVTGAMGSVGSGGLIYAAKHNELAYNSRILQSHTHPINDRTS